MNIFWLTLAVLLWGIVHSFMASLAAKDWVHTVLGEAGRRFYRLFYNVFSVISFAPILWLMAVLPDQVLYRIPAPWVYLSIAGQMAAVVMLVVGVLQTDTLSFVGLRQLIEGEQRESKLVTRGLYRWVRHPLYTAGLLFIWLTPVMSQNSLVVTIAATIYIIVGAIFEERKLKHEFGQAYERYKAETPMLIPGLKFGRNK
ncbi:MAG: isoprenylcysteine carboxylmethyltransferase family protein [Anaerolineales bacterium]